MGRVAQGCVRVWLEGVFLEISGKFSRISGEFQRSWGCFEALRRFKRVSRGLSGMSTGEVGAF